MKVSTIVKVLLTIVCMLVSIVIGLVLDYMSVATFLIGYIVGFTCYGIVTIVENKGDKR